MLFRDCTEIQFEILITQGSENVLIYAFLWFATSE